MVCLRFSIFLFSLIFFWGCNDNAETVSPAPQNNSKDPIQTDNDLTGTDFNILFVGNSLTYTNDLPGLVKIIADSNGLNIGIKMLAYPDYAISDHWESGTVQDLIASKVFDFVVIQQGPSSQALGREILIEYGKKYSELCKANDVKLAFFMVWPSLDYYETFDGVIKNYRDAATINNALLCPVGEVWKQHFDNTNDFTYYGPDGFHPSYTGTKVAARVIAGVLF